MQDSPIAVARYGSAGASARVRLHDWFAHLSVVPEHWDYLGGSNNQMGTLLRQLPEVAKAELRLRTSSSRLRGRTLIMSRGATPFSSGHLERSLLRRAGHSVYDFDDAIFASQSSAARKVWERSVAAADVVIAGSEVLAEAASTIRSDVELIPSCVEPDHYVMKRSYEITGSPRAVWIGSPSTERFLVDISDELLELNRLLGLRLKVISAGNASLGSLDAMVDRVSWSPDTFRDQIADADFGLMPLPDNAFERGKCAYKLLQYGAAALPGIGSPVGANVQALTRLGGIAAASSGRSWIDAITGVIEATPEEREKMGALARTGVEEHYSYSSWAAKWLRATGLGNVRVSDGRNG